MKIFTYVLLIGVVIFNTHCTSSSNDSKDQTVNNNPKEQTIPDTTAQQPTSKRDTLADFLFAVLPGYYENQQHFDAHALGVPDTLIDFTSGNVPIKLRFDQDTYDDYLLVKEYNMYFAEGVLVNGKNGEIFPLASSFKKVDSSGLENPPFFWHRGTDSKFKVVDVDGTDGLKDLAVMYRRNAIGDETYIFQIYSLNKEIHSCDLIFEYEVSSSRYTLDLDTDSIGNITNKEHYIDILDSESRDIDTINIYATKSHEYMKEFPGIAWKSHNQEKLMTFVFDYKKRVYKREELLSTKAKIH